MNPPAHQDVFAQISDEELACQVQAGSSSCFAELISRHGNRLLSFLYRRTGHLQDAEDLLQDTFTRAYQNIGLYRPRWKMTTWLFTIATRLACNHHRKAHGARKAITLREEIDLHDPSDGIVAREENQNFWTLARQTLSEYQFMALWLRYAEDQPIREISEILGKTQTHVKVLLYRARMGMARQLKGALATEGRSYQPPQRHGLLKAAAKEGA